MYSIKGTYQVERPSFKLGKHTVKVESLEMLTIGDAPAMKWIFGEILPEDAEETPKAYEHLEIEPKEGDDERDEWPDGGIKASKLDHKLMRIVEIVKAINPKVEPRFEFESWEDIQNWCKESFVQDAVVDIKLLNTYKGNATVNGLVAGVSKEGEVYVSKAKKFIAPEDTLPALSAKELAKIEATQASSPDDMMMGTIGDVDDVI